MKKLTHDIKFPVGSGKYDVWFFAICIFCLVMPFFMWQLSSKPFLIVCAFLSIKNLRKSNKSFFGILMFLLYLYSGIISNWSFFGILFLLLLIPIFFAKPKFIMQSFDVFIYIFSIMLIPSILQYVLVSILGMDMPHKGIAGLNYGKSGVYSQYLFMVTYSGNDLLVDKILPRFYSYFDEPGVVGTIAAIILYVKKFNLKSWVNIPIFIAGIFSFSLAFYLLTSIYFLIFVKNNYKLILLPTLVLGIIYFSDNEIFRLHILDRLNIDSDFLENFMNRRDGGNFDIWYSNFKKSPQYYSGMGAGYNLLVNIGGNSYKNIITDFGIIFFIMFMLAYVLYGIRNLKLSRELLMALILFFGIMYQRPSILELSSIFLIYAPFVFFQEEKRESILLLKDERRRRI